MEEVYDDMIEMSLEEAQEIDPRYEIGDAIEFQVTPRDFGRIAAQKLIGEDFKVTKQHGEFIEKNGVLMMGTFHPAALLRNPNNKPQALEDFLKLRDKIKEVCTHTY